MIFSASRFIVELCVGRSRYAEKLHLTAPRVILHDHALADEGGAQLRGDKPA